MSKNLFDKEIDPGSWETDFIPEGEISLNRQTSGLEQVEYLPAEEICSARASVENSEPSPLDGVQCPTP